MHASVRRAVCSTLQRGNNRFFNEPLAQGDPELKNPLNDPDPY